MSESDRAAGAEDVVLRVRGMCKRFGPNQVLDGVDIELRRGEILALMGPNGSGKSTLIKILDGVYRRDAGSVEVGGVAVQSFADAESVGVIHQDLGLVDDLTVLDNLRLGHPGRLRNRFAETRAAERALARVQLTHVRPRTQVGDLTPVEKAMLAVARLLESGAQTIVVDETTLTMSEREAQWLINHLRQEAKERGTAVLIVSHRLRDISTGADRVVVLVDGKIVADDPVRLFQDDPHRVVRLFAGGADHAAPAVPAERDAAPVVAGRGASRPLITFRDADVGAVRGVNLELRAGGVTGLTGALGSGLHQVGLAVAGEVPVRRGALTRAPGVVVAVVPPQRETQSVLPELSVAANILVPNTDRKLSRLGVTSVLSGRRDVDRLMRELQIKPQDPTLPIRVLSGGNQQKAVFARAIRQRADVYVLCEPTRGVDVTTRAEIYRIIREQAGKGAAVLVCSSDIEDVLAVCDTVRTVTDTAVGPERTVTEMSENDLAGML